MILISKSGEGTAGGPRSWVLVRRSGARARRVSQYRPAHSLRESDSKGEQVLLVCEGQTLVCGIGYAYCFNLGADRIHDRRFAANAIVRAHRSVPSAITAM